MTDTLFSASNQELFRNIIYPSADLVLKSIIGIFLAYLLHRRGSQDKRKELLIETYMEYLDTIKKWVGYQVTQYGISLLDKIKDLVRASDIDEVRRSDILNNVIDQTTQLTNKFDERYANEDANWSPFTYRFCLLLGKGYYFKKLSHLSL